MGGTQLYVKKKKSSMSELPFNSDSPPLRGWKGGLRVAFGGCILVFIIVSHPRTGFPVSADYRLFFALHMLLPRTWHLASISQGMIRFEPLQIRFALFCLKDICQDHTGFPPAGRSGETIISSLLRAKSPQHCASSKVSRLMAQLPLQVRLNVCQLIKRKGSQVNRHR